MSAGAMVVYAAALILPTAPVPLAKPVPGYPSLAEVRAAFGQKYSTRQVRTLGQHCGNPEMSFTVWAAENPKRVLGPHFHWAWKPTDSQVVRVRSPLSRCGREG